MKQQDKQAEDKKARYAAIAKYSGLGLEMAVAILGTAFIGTKLDARVGNETPIYTLILSFLGVIYVFYRIFKISSSDS